MVDKVRSIAYSKLSSVRSLVSYKIFNAFLIFSISSFADFVSSSNCFVVAYHEVISQEIWSAMSCSSGVIQPGMVVGSLVLWFTNVLSLPLISFFIRARCFSRFLMDSLGCSSSPSKSKFSKSFVRMTRSSLVATSLAETISTQQSAKFSNLVSQSFTRPNSL
jgi:hypothetical protein